MHLPLKLPYFILKMLIELKKLFPRANGMIELISLEVIKE
jgi:hypothetical protein